MVFAFKPVKAELLKSPSPVPSLLVLSEVVGDELVLQQTPFAVIASPPSLIVAAPPIAEQLVIDEAAFVVVMVGAVALDAANISMAIGKACVPEGVEVNECEPADLASDTPPKDLRLSTVACHVELLKL